jgi:propanol-preferring alcohol dehydrogenase
MLAVRTHAPGEPLVSEQVEVPAPSGEEVLVRVAACGVCHTDLHIARTDIVRARRPVTLGHEISGWVESAGPAAERGLDDAGITKGVPVLVYGGWGCGQCDRCVATEEQACDRRVAPGFTRDGGYAEFVLVPHWRHLLPLGSIDPVTAAPLADAALTSYRAVRRAAFWLREGTTALVIGVGGLGQFAVQFLRQHAGVTIAVTDTDEGKMRRGLELGATRAIPAGEDVEGSATDGQVDVAFDFVGTDESLARASQLVRRGGLLSLVGEAGGTIPFGYRKVPIEIYLTTTSWGSRDELQAVLKLARAGAIRWDVEPMTLAQAVEAHDRLAAGDVAGRLVLVPDGTA